jgi:hypothetical protein
VALPGAYTPASITLRFTGARKPTLHDKAVALEEEINIQKYCYATIERRNMRCFVTAGKHINNIRAITRQSPITIGKLLEAVFSVGSAPRIYNEDPRPAE